MRKVIGLDTETFLIEPGILAPKLVCLTLAGGKDTLEQAKALASTLKDCSLVTPYSSQEWEMLIGVAEDQNEVVEAVCWAIEEADCVVSHNLSFDLAVLCAMEPAFTDVFFDALEQGKLRCTMVRETLICIARNWLIYDPRIGPKGLKRSGDNARVALWQLVFAYYGKDIRGDKKTLSSLQKAGVPKSAWPWRLKYDTLLGVPVATWPAKAASYAREDATWHRRAFRKQSLPMALAEGPVVSEGDVVNERAQTCAAWAMHLMAVHGITIDPEMAKRFEAKVREDVKSSRLAGAQLGFVRINACRTCKGTGYLYEVPNLQLCDVCRAQPGLSPDGRPAPKSWSQKDSKRLKAWVSEAYGGRPPMTEPSTRYPKGQVKTDAETLLASGMPKLVEFAEGSFSEKLLSTYVPILRNAVSSGAPINALWNILVRSGRTSCAKPNWQNPPQKGGFRECVVPRKGHLIAACDYTGQEMVTLAQTLIDLFGKEPAFVCHLAEAINQGKDLHGMFAAQMLGISYSEWSSQYRAGDSRAAEYRQRAKAGNFGFPGGLGTETFVVYARGYGLDLAALDPNGDAMAAAASLKKDWMETWPEMRKYFALISMACSRSEDGRFNLVQLPTGRIRGGCHYTSGANSYFQGRGADATKDAMFHVSAECYTGYSSIWPRDGREPSPLYQCRLIAMIHDELLVEGPDTDTAWALRLRDVMVERMKPYTPDVLVQAEVALMPRWFKKAEPVYVGGKLRPWYPGLHKGAVSESDYADAQLNYQSGAWRK